MSDTWPGGYESGERVTGIGLHSGPGTVATRKFCMGQEEIQRGKDVRNTGIRAGLVPVIFDDVGCFWVSTCQIRRMEEAPEKDEPKTFSGLMSAVSGLGQKDIKEIWAEVKENHARLEGCPRHEFVKIDEVGKLMATYLCAKCGGTIDAIAHSWYQRGLDHSKEEKKA